MKILHLVTSDFFGGAAKATFRIHSALRKLGQDSWMYVQSKQTDDFTCLGPQTRAGAFFAPLRCDLDKLGLIFYPHRTKPLFSPNLLSASLKVIDKMNPDLVHLHWINDGFISIQNIAEIKRPLVWSLQDMWPFTGGCHYDEDCGKFRKACGSCPALGSKKETDLSHRIWNQKSKAFSRAELNLIAPTTWIKECAQESSLFKNTRVELIPNGVDLSLFNRKDRKLCRDLLQLPQDKTLILFGAMNATSDSRKGFHLLIPALENLSRTLPHPQNVEVVILGASKPKNPFSFGLRTHYIPAVQDEMSLAVVYSAVDVLVAPSIQENLSNMVLEGLACGTPAAAFSIGGMPELIDHKQNGYLAAALSSEDLAGGIRWIVQDKTRWQELSQQAREKAQFKFDVVKTASSYANFYTEIIRKH